MADDDGFGDDHPRMAAPDRLACATPDVVPVVAFMLGSIALVAGLVALVVMYA